MLAWKTAEKYLKKNLPNIVHKYEWTLTFACFVDSTNTPFSTHTVAMYSWSIAINFVIGFYCRCLEILCQIAFSSLGNCFRSYSILQFGIKSVGIYSRRL